MRKKFLSLFLCLLFFVSLSAPRAAAAGVTGAALTVAEMAGVVSLIAGSLGIVFTGAGDMHDACEAFVEGLDPNSSAYLALASAVAQGSTIYIAGTNAVNYLGGLVDSIRDFFIPGGDVVSGGSGVTISNMGQIANGSGALPSTDTTTTRFNVLSSPVVFTDVNGNEVGWISVSKSEYTTDSTGVNYRFITRSQNSTGNHMIDKNIWNRDGFGDYIYFGVVNGYICPIYVYYQQGVVRTSNLLTSPSSGISYSLVSDVSGGGEVPIDIPVYQEAGALAPDLVGGVWDKLAEDAAAQDGNVTIDTNVGTYQGGATGYVDGDPNGVIAAPQAPSLGGAGSTKTETDTSTGTTTQTQTQTGTQAVPQSQTANPAISKVQAQTTFNGATLTLADIFPFCIPFDIYAMITSLAAARETPTFDVRLFYPGWLDYTYTFDFSDWDNVAAVLRAAELGAFVIGLAAATRKFIKW